MLYSRAFFHAGRACGQRHVSNTVKSEAGGLSFDPTRLSPLMADIRSRINESAISRGYAPRVAELSSDLGVAELDIRNALADLADIHALVLHPVGEHEREGEVWVAHPFAFFPTNFQVEFGDNGRRVQSPCIWCSLGVAATLHQVHGRDCTIHTCAGGHPDQPVSIHVQGGRVVGDKAAWKAHFLVPAREAWGEKKGDVRSLEEAMRMATGWYGHYLEKPWRKLSPTEVRSLFYSTGFNNQFWSLE